jgi:hypothetical protein
LFQTCQVGEAPKYFFLWIWAAGRARRSGALVMAFLLLVDGRSVFEGGCVVSGKPGIRDARAVTFSHFPPGWEWEA